MCQIQILHKLNGTKLDDRDLEEFYKLMCFGSISNDDAWGVFNSKCYTKKSGGFDSVVLNKNNLIDSTFIVGHNRLATSGEGINWGWDLLIPKPFNYFAEQKNEQMNHHPFILNNLLLAHNGIISNAFKLREEFNIKSKIQTDSYVILYLINHYLDTSNEPDRIKRIVRAIQKTTKQLDGSYSVVLYDKETGSLFYFKNFQTEFNFRIINGDTLVGSTIDKNIDYVYFGYPKEPIKIKDNHIYVTNKTCVLKDVGEFKEKPILFGGKQKSEIESFFKEFLGYIPSYKFNKLGDILVKNEKGLVKKLTKQTDVFVGKKYVKIPINNIVLKGGGWLNGLRKLCIK